VAMQDFLIKWVVLPKTVQSYSYKTAQAAFGELKSGKVPPEALIPPPTSKISKKKAHWPYFPLAASSIS